MIFEIFANLYDSMILRFSGGLGSARLMVGLHGLKGLFQPKQFYDSVILCQQQKGEQPRSPPGTNPVQAPLPKTAQEPRAPANRPVISSQAVKAERTDRQTGQT